MRLLLALLAALLIAAPAHAHLSPTSRVHNARHVATQIWGPTVCGDTMAVPIVRVALPPPIAARAFPDRCHIELNDQRWTTFALCVSLVHEIGHLADWRAAPGQAFIRPDGTIDDVHSRNPRSVMYPTIIAAFPPCAPPRARHRST